MTQEKQGLDKFLDWAANQPASTPEERAEAEAARKSMAGKWIETVTMDENGALFIVTNQYFTEGGSGQGSSESAPGDPDYEELLQEHGRLVPGKAHTLVRMMADGKWVVLPESDEVIPYRPNETKTA